MDATESLRIHDYRFTIRDEFTGSDGNPMTESHAMFQHAATCWCGFGDDEWVSLYLGTYDEARDAIDQQAVNAIARETH